MAKKSSMGITTPVLYIVLGVLLAVFRSQMLNWAMTLAGLFFIITGIIDVSKKRAFSGAINLIIGIAILVLGWALTNIVLLVLGVLIALKGLVEFIEVMRLKKKKRSFLRLAFPILTVIVGLGLAFGNALDHIIVAVGIILIVDGVLGILGAKK
ncbi:MAG: DUF308 domain-containing protein [Clostridia bacterium]|nr:DUF308 domain-containing protein [Clostridia bacterium]